ncbi:putative methyltransferase nsun7 [Entophlyctis luteolus]|nr:putative methyltransferase nsun7 [Entophlyctis luteolus]
MLNPKALSEPNLMLRHPGATEKPHHLQASQSEPVLASRKNHPLLEDDLSNIPYSYAELLYGAETLENIAADGFYTGNTLKQLKIVPNGAEMTDRILRLVYGTMKYLPYIDTILVKTQFLVYNNQFLNCLGLVKVLMYDLMKCQFDFSCYHGIDYMQAKSSADDVEHGVALVSDLELALRNFQIKLAAAFARVRIERRAAGATSREMLENILPEEVRKKEHLAVEMSKTLRINYLKTNKSQVLDEIKAAGFNVKTTRASISDPADLASGNFIRIDDMFNDFLVIPTEYFSDIKNSPVVTEGRLIFQDKASAYGIRHLTSLISETDHIIDTRAGCGTHVSYLASLMKNRGKIFAFENRPSRLQSLKIRLANQNVKSKIRTALEQKITKVLDVQIIEQDFVTADAESNQFAEVSTIIIEPPNSGTAIVDKLGYLLQEEEFPSDQHSQKDIQSLKRRQKNLLEHAFTLENEALVSECLDRHGMDGKKEKWELNCVLPDIVVSKEFDWEIEDCLKIKPTKTGNGIFVACFIRTVESSHESSESEQSQEAAPATNETPDVPEPIKRTKRTKQKGNVKKVGNKQEDGNTVQAQKKLLRRLSKRITLSVERLSAPVIHGNDAVESQFGSQDWVRSTDDKKVRKQALNRHDSKGVQEEFKVSKGNSQSDFANDIPKEKKAATVEDDMNVFGVSLKKFYEPQIQAIKELADQNVDSEPKKWKYPVSTQK